jgi:hypothetical protein
MPPETVAWFQDGPAFEVLDSAVRVVARYPDDPEDVLLSVGAASGAGGGRAALVESGSGPVGWCCSASGRSTVAKCGHLSLLFNSLQVP